MIHFLRARHSSSGAAATPAPSNTVAPAVTGTTTQGQTLTCTSGTWLNATSYAYQWQRADDSGFTTNVATIGGATSNTYVLTATEVGKYVRCQVTATGVGGNTVANSNAVGSIAASATRLFFNNAGTPPGGVTKDTTAPKVGAGGWTAAPYYGFADRYNAGYVGTQNVWLWRGGGVGWDAGDSACYRIPCTVGATVAVRAYAYDGYGTASAPYIMKQKYSGGYRRQVSASPDMVQVQNGGSGAVMVNTFNDIDNAGYIDVRVEGSNYYCWCGLDYVESSNTGDLPTAWAF